LFLCFGFLVASAACISDVNGGRVAIRVWPRLGRERGRQGEADGRSLAKALGAFSITGPGIGAGSWCPGRPAGAQQHSGQRLSATNSGLGLRTAEMTDENTNHPPLQLAQVSRCTYRREFRRLPRSLHLKMRMRVPEILTYAAIDEKMRAVRMPLKRESALYCTAAAIDLSAAPH
jgi:hypothetical protein